MFKEALGSFAAVAALVLMGSTPASADPGAMDWPTLTAEASVAGTAEPITLDSDISEPGSILPVERTVTLDLNGSTLEVLSVKISDGATLTITDSSGAQSGALIADASPVVPTPPPFEYTPGINVTAGALVIAGGNVTAIGGVMAAGIGGGDLSDSGPITITGGNIAATSGEFAAGIGGGNGGSATDVTITGGIVTATSTDRGAGIGGGFTGSGGNITIAGGTVHAAGGERGAGIGDGGSIVANDNAPIAGSNVVIDGGTVTAQGGTYAAGIGGGFMGGAVSVTIDGGTIAATGGGRGAGIGTGQQTGVSTAAITLTAGQTTAIGGELAAAIGGGRLSAGGTTVVGVDALLTTHSDGSAGATAFGAGENDTGLSFGTVQIDGTVEIASGGIIIADSNLSAPEIHVTASGRMQGPAGEPDPTIAASGPGQIQNDGTIAATLVPMPCTASDCTPEPLPSVNGNDFLITFDAAQHGGSTSTIRLLATTFDAAGFALPAAPELTQWNVVTDGAATPFTTTTQVAADTTVVAVAGTVSLSSETVIAGNAAEFSVEVRDATGNVVSPDGLAIVLTSSNIGDTVDGLTVTATEAGSRTITVSVNDGTMTSTGTLDVSAAPVAELTIAAPSNSVTQGSSLTFQVDGADAFGNPVDTHGAALTSSVTTDIVDGLTVSFPKASPHVITATLNGMSASVTIEVIPTPVAVTPEQLPSTGSDSSIVGPISGVAVLLLLGGALLMMHRRKLGSA